MQYAKHPFHMPYAIALSNVSARFPQDYPPDAPSPNQPSVFFPFLSKKVHGAQNKKVLWGSAWCAVVHTKNKLKKQVPASCASEKKCQTK